MSAIHNRLLLLFLMLSLGIGKSFANGCTGSWFTIQYSPWCNCYQVCGNYISDCDEVVSISWNFGDGTTGSGESPCHVYANPGTYTVTMTIVAYCHNVLFNIFTTTCHITQTLSVVNQTGLTAGFTADTVCMGDGMQFTSTSIAPWGFNNYTWLFGDGTTGTGASPNHVYDTCGAYDVTLIVQNTVPCCSIPGYDTITHRVYVNCDPFEQPNALGSTEPYITTSNATLATSGISCAGSVTQFQLTPSQHISNWLFHFPDSSTSTLPNPTYVYTQCPPAVDYTTVDLWSDHGCEGIIDSITGIFCPSNLGLTATTTLCTGQCSGTATVTMTGGGTPPFTVTWSDPAAQTTPTAIGLCPPGPYTVTVTDGNGCTATIPNGIAIPDFPFPFTGVVSLGSAVLCYGSSTGSALLTATGGTPGYTYFWDNGSTADSITNVVAGIHSVTATDAHGCIFIGTINIPQPPPIGASFVPVNANCNVCDGSVTVTGSGGTPPYFYTWLTSPYGTNTTLNGLCAGIYNVEVSDWNWCRDTFSVSISENGSQPVTATSTDATCANICNGTATGVLTGGCLSPPCNVVWQDSLGNSIGQTNLTATSLCGGDYYIHVTNGAGCNSFASTTVNIPNPVIATATATINSCAGSCNGTITVTGSGGMPPYSYQWLDNTGTVIPGQTSSTIINLCAGNYTARMIDASGCIGDDPITVFSNLLTAADSFNSVLCNGDCSGMILAFTNGGVPPYTYSTINSSSVTVYSGPSFVVANLCADTYTLNVTDAGNCTVSLPVTITEPLPLNAVTNPVSPNCFDGCNGTISVVVSGGTLPYTYNWISNGNSIGTNPTVTNLCAGTYTLQISDANNCATPNIPVALTEPSLVEDSIHIIDPYCANGAGGTLDLTVWGGVPPYSYSWSNSAVTEDIAGLANGNYSVTIFDAAGCGTVDSATFTSLPALSVTITATLHNGYHFKCNGGTDGEVVVDVTGGMPPYSYQWNDSLQSTVDSIYGLPAGNYTVTVTDAGGCVYLDSISLNLIPPVFDASITSLNPTCSGAANGSVTAVPVGGTTPYTYYWNYDTTLLNIPLTNIDTGQYILIIFDGTFCLVLDTVILTEPAPVTSSYTQVDVTCNGGTDGSIDYTVNGGTLPFTYSWNGGTYTTEDIASLTAGQYIIVALDSNLCPVSDTVQITEPPALQTQITSVNETCFGGSNASIDLTLLTGATPFTFNWNSGQYSIEDPQNILAGNYSVVVTDNNSCTVSASVTITEPTLITGNRQVTICATDSFFVGGAYQNTAGIYTDNLTAANGCDSILTTDLSTINVFNTQFTKTVCYGEQFIFNGVTYNASGNYLDTLTSTGGCDSVVSLTLNVLPDIDLSATPNHATIIAGDSVGVAVQSNSGTYIPNYTWTPQLNISCLDTACSQVLLFPQANTQYTVVAIDSNGCRDAVVVPIFVNGTPIFIPNVFTPNSDGANDFFEIYGNLKLLRYLEIQVFNRWGEKVFESNNFHFKWDGTYKGVAQTPSVFVWVLKLGFTDSPVEQIRKGSVTLMK